MFQFCWTRRCWVALITFINHGALGTISPRAAWKIVNSYEEILEDLLAAGTTVSNRTISNELHRHGLKSPTQGPLAAEKALTLKVGPWTILTNLLSSRIVSHGMRKQVWKWQSMLLSIMIWECFSAMGTGSIYVYKFTNEGIYRGILDNNDFASVQKIRLGDKWIFQWDNDPKHTARIAQQWFLLNNGKELQSTSHSPDCNPIENLW